MRLQLNTRTFWPHYSSSSSMPHAWSKPKSWTCHCSSFRAFKNFFFQLKEPEPVEEGLLDMIKTAAGFFFSWQCFLPCSSCSPGINFESILSFLICCKVWKFSTRWVSLDNYYQEWFPCWAENNFSDLTTSDVAERWGSWKL